MAVLFTFNYRNFLMETYIIVMYVFLLVFLLYHLVHFHSRYLINPLIISNNQAKIQNSWTIFYIDKDEIKEDPYRIILS